jgi:hypothetical protein
MGDTEYACGIADIVREYVRGPSDNQRTWRAGLLAAIEDVLRRDDGNIEGVSILISLRETLRSDRFIDEHSSVLRLVLQPR